VRPAIAFTILLVAIAFAVLALAAWVLQMNLADLLAKGPNFWNCFWILLAVAVAVSGGARLVR
jgi:hypothetical protein